MAIDLILENGKPADDWLSDIIVCSCSCLAHYLLIYHNQPQSNRKKMSTCKNSSSSCCASATCGAAATNKQSNANNNTIYCASTSSSNETLKLAARASLASFLSTRLSSNGDIAQDVYRAMRDEAHLLLERQMLSDALDSDPFELMRVSSGGAENEKEEEEVDDSVLLDKKKNRQMIERFKVSHHLCCVCIYSRCFLSPLMHKK